jgi:hypothetical protein
MNIERVHPFKEVFGKTKFGIDVDGVVAMSVVPVLAQVNSDLGTDYRIMDFSGWHSVRDWALPVFIQRRMPESVALKAATEYDTRVWTDPDLLGAAPVNRGAEAFIKRLHNEGIEYYFVTSRIPELFDSTIRWFRRNLPWVDPSLIRLNTDPGLLGADFKWQTVAKLGIGIHIDDHIEHAKLILERTFASTILLSNLGDLGSKHPRFYRVTAEGRLPDMRDLHKRLLFNNPFSVAQSIDNIPPLG